MGKRGCSKKVNDQKPRANQFHVIFISFINMYLISRVFISFEDIVFFCWQNPQFIFGPKKLSFLACFKTMRKTYCKANLSLLTVLF